MHRKLWGAHEGQGLGTSGDSLWQYGDGTNLIGVPSAFVASAGFNTSGRPLHIAGVREMNNDLFRMLESATDHEECAAIFTAYMATMFGLAARPADTQEQGARRHYRSSYLRLLRGWAYDSNSPEGAVMKGWVESRFGLFPTFHKVKLKHFDVSGWTRYVEEKMASRFHNNAILSQLDLLYEFAQWSLAHDPAAGGAPLRLYRGVNDFDEHQMVERLDRRQVILRLNNLVSFTTDREVASCFGDCILETRVPPAKILFFNALLPRHALKGEDEVLAIGGDYQVRVGYY